MISSVHRLALSALVVGSVAWVVGGGTYAAFTGTTRNAGNSISAGTVELSDNDTGGALLSLEDAEPGDSDRGCILIRYEGSLDATVRLYGTAIGALPEHLHLRVVRGSTDGAFASCAAFAPDRTDHIGEGRGVVYDGLLSDYPADYVHGVWDAPGSAATWSTGDAHAYRFEITLEPGSASEGLTTTATFTWEARNL